MKLFKKLLGKIRKRHIAKKVKRKLIEKYEHDYELELILEQWIIKRILDGQVERRKELTEKQARIKEMSLFINYFKNLKK